MKICIPTYKRSDNQITLKSIPDNLLKETFLICNKFEANELKKYNANIFAIPDSIKGIGNVRQFVLENNNFNCDEILFLDDDLSFLKRIDNTIKLKKIDKENFSELYYWFKNQLNSFGIAGLSMQAGNNRYNGDHIYFGRIFSVYALKISTLKKHNIRFDEMEVMEDFNVVLDLLRHGYKTIINTKFAHTQKASNQKGGCSESGRTNEVQKKSALYLAEKHSPFVNVVKKKSKNWIGMEERYDVKIFWKKAYEKGRYGKYN